MLHRDLSTKNIFLSEAGDAVVGDLGLSKQLTGGSGEIGRTKVGTQVGTPPYMSPELVRGEEYGTSSDVWAVGVVLFEMLALRRPFDGTNMLEVAGLIFALHYNHKVGSAFEAITLTEREFRFSRVDHWGKRRHWTFQPQWLQFRVDGPSRQLIAGTHGKRIVIGKFLNLDEKEALCATLEREIRRLGEIRYEGAGVT